MRGVAGQGGQGEAGEAVRVWHGMAGHGRVRLG